MLGFAGKLFVLQNNAFLTKYLTKIAPRFQKNQLARENY